jgi:hypothetical protein
MRVHEFDDIVFVYIDFLTNLRNLRQIGKVGIFCSYYGYMFISRHIYLKTL